MAHLTDTKTPRYLKGSAGKREACAGARVMHYDENPGEPK
jgi:hypothetical protein